MNTITNLIGAGAVLLLAAGSVSASPCTTGTTTSSVGPTTKDMSSNVETNVAPRTTPGTKGESAGTVGAMNNAGAGSTPGKGEKPAPVGKVVKPGDDDC